MPLPRVVSVVPYLSRGGVGAVLQCGLTAIRERFDPFVICLEKEGGRARAFEEAGIPFAVMGFRSRWSTLPFARLVRTLRRLKPAIVQGHMYWANTAGTAAARLAAVPVRIGTVHNVDPWGSESQVRMERRFQPWLAAVLCVSEAVRRDYCDRMGRDPRSCFTVHNGIDLSAFQAPCDRERVRRELGIPQDRWVVGVVSRLVRWKGIEAYLEAARLIYRKARDAHFLIVGEGEMRRELESRSRAWGLDGVITFAGHRYDVPAMLQVMDCFLFPSGREEGFGLAVIEAMAAGVPVVAGDRTCFREIITCPGEGLLVGGDDAGALADAVLRVLGDGNLREEMASRGRARAREFSIEGSAGRTMEIYDRLLSGSG